MSFSEFGSKLDMTEARFVSGACLSKRTVPSIKFFAVCP